MTFICFASRYYMQRKMSLPNMLCWAGALKNKHVSACLRWCGLFAYICKNSNLAYSSCSIDSLSFNYPITYDSNIQHSLSRRNSWHTVHLRIIPCMPLSINVQKHLKYNELSLFKHQMNNQWVAVCYFDRYDESLNQDFYGSSTIVYLYNEVLNYFSTDECSLLN